MASSRNLRHAWVLVVFLGLAAAVQVQEAVELDDDGVEVLDEVPTQEPEPTPTKPSTSTQSTETPHNNNNVTAPNGIAGHNPGMFVEVTSSERMFVRDAAPGTRAEATVTPEDNRTLFTSELLSAVGGLKPRFAGGTEYFTGENYLSQPTPGNTQLDGVAFPAPLGQISVKAARFNHPIDMSSVTYTDDNGNVTRREIIMADNQRIFNAKENKWEEVEGKVRVIDSATGATSSIQELREPDGIYSVASHSVNVSGVMSTIVYTAVMDSGFYWYNLDTKTKTRLIVPNFNDAVDWDNKTSVGEFKRTIGDMTGVCLATDANKSVYLHYNGKIYDFPSKDCGKDKVCKVRSVTDWPHYKEFKPMKCAVHVSGDSITFFATQGSTVASMDIAPALLPTPEATTAKVLAQELSTGSNDGASPHLGNITGLSLYSPPWAPDDEIYVAVVSNGQLKMMSSKTGYTSTIAQVGAGPVAVAGEFAYSGEKLLWKSKLAYNIPCAHLNYHLSRPLLEWKVPVDKIRAVETVSVGLDDGKTSQTWEFTAMKSTAVLKQGFIEKTMVCMNRLTEMVNTTRQKHTHCCLTKFSKQHQAREWADQIFETEMF